MTTKAAPLLDPDPGVTKVEAPDYPASNLVPAEGANLVLMFERLAKDPAVDPDKLEKLIDLQERIIRHNAESAFWEAFSEMQGELPTINEDGAIVVNSVIRSRYSTNENIQEVIRPILQRHGFSLSFRNRSTEKGLEVTGILAHRGGHKERDTFESKPDDGGSMNSIQRIGSTRSYGQRYTTIALLNIVSRAPQDRDDDGELSEEKPLPDGFEEWVLDLEAAVPKGTAALMKAFNDGSEQLRKHLALQRKQSWNSLKARAAEAAKGGTR